MLVELEGE